MAHTAIQPPDMADPRPRYPHGWRVGNTVYVAGQPALAKDGKLVGPKDIGAQTRRVLENMQQRRSSFSRRCPRDASTPGADRHNAERVTHRTG